jgi:hypothetical protein
MSWPTRTQAFHRIALAVTLAAMVGGGLPACGASIRYTVDEDLLQRLPKASRRSVYQAETVVTIAIDAKGAEKRKVDNALRENDRLEAKLAEAKLRRAKAAGNQVATIDLEIRMLKARLAYNDELVDHQRIRIKLADKELTLARAQFELAKARLVEKHSISSSASVKDFEEQVTDIQAHVLKFRKKVEADAADLKEEEARWLEAKKAYYSAIGESSKGWWTEQ